MSVFRLFCSHLLISVAVQCLCDDSAVLPYLAYSGITDVILASTWCDFFTYILGED